MALNVGHDIATVQGVCHGVTESDRTEELSEQASKDASKGDYGDHVLYFRKQIYLQ